MKFLKKIHELKQESKSLILMLDDALSGIEKPRSNAIIHASALTSDYTAFCPREIAILDMTKKKQADKYINSSLRITFDVGDAYSDLVREKWLQDSVVGHWKCNHCHSVTKFSKKPKVDCVVCGHKHYRYEEVVAYVPELNVSGSLDMIVDFKGTKHTLVEIKSIDKDYFVALEAPMAEHRIRTNLYLHLIAMSKSPYMDRIDTTQAKILYVSKGFGKKSIEHGFITPFKEYTIEKTDAGVKPYMTMLQEITDFRNLREKYPNRICANPLTTRAKNCSCNKECWGTLPPLTPKDE